MADNVAITAGSGTSVATDEIQVSGTGTLGHVQYVKLVDGTLNGTGAIGGDATNGLDVDVTRVPADPFGANADAASATGSISAKLRYVAATGIPVTAVTPGTGTAALGKQEGEAHVAGNTGVLLLGVRNTSHSAFTGVVQGDYAPINVDAEGCVVVVGNVAHDAPDADPPMKLGHRAVNLGATPTAVAAADRTDWLATRAGVPFVLGGHPNIQSSEYFTSGAITDDNILPAIAAGSAYVITGIMVTCSNANVTSPSVRIGFGTSTLTAQGATNADGVAKIILSHPGIAPGSGVVKGNGAGIIGIGASDEELRITCSTPTTSLIVQVDWFSIAI